MKTLIKNVHLTEKYGSGNNTVNILIENEFIKYVGKDSDFEGVDRVIEGNGNLVIPGFYNAHCHSSMTLFRGYGDDLPLDTWLNTRIFPAEENLSDERTYWGTMLATAEMLRGGIVSFSDMYMFMDSVARAVNETGIKANLARSIVSFDKDIEMKNDFRTLESIEFANKWHGANGGRIKVDMSLHAEYTNVEKCARYVGEYAVEHSLRMQFHLSETEKEHVECIQRHGLTPTEFFLRAGVLDAPSTAAHCVYLTENDMDILAEKGTYVAHNPVSNLKLGSGIMPYSLMREHGVNIALGTDGVASNNRLDMIRELQFAALIHKGNERNAAATNARDIIDMATVNGARSQGRDDCGEIMAGYRADLVMIDMSALNNIPTYNYESTLAYSAKTEDVVLTMVDGDILYRNGEYTTIDKERLAHEFKSVVDHYFD